MKKIINILSYDSNLFGYNVGVLNLNKDIKAKDIIEQCLHSNVTLLYIFVNDNEEYSVLNEINAVHVDTKVVFTKSVNKASENTISNIRCFNNKDDKKALIQLAFLSGDFSRFKLDKNFVKKEFEKLYKDWIEKSIGNINSDEVLVYEHNKVISGFVTYKITKGTLNIGLIAVNENHQGMGIGKALLNKIYEIAYDNNVMEINVATQQINHKAMSFYSINNYIIKEKKKIFHLWKK